MGQDDFDFTESKCVCVCELRARVWSICFSRCFSVMLGLLSETCFSDKVGELLNLLPLCLLVVLGD